MLVQLLWQIRRLQSEQFPRWSLWLVQPLQRGHLTKLPLAGKDGWSSDDLLPGAEQHSKVLIIKSCFYFALWLFVELKNIDLPSIVCVCIFGANHMMINSLELILLQWPCLHDLKSWDRFLSTRLNIFHWLSLLDSASTNKLLGSLLCFLWFVSFVSLSWFHSLLLEATLALKIEKFMAHI